MAYNRIAFGQHANQVKQKTLGQIAEEGMSIEEIFHFGTSQLALNRLVGNMDQDALHYLQGKDKAFEKNYAELIGPFQKENREEYNATQYDYASKFVRKIDSNKEKSLEAFNSIFESGKTTEEIVQAFSAEKISPQVQQILNTTQSG